MNDTVPGHVGRTTAEEQPSQRPGISGGSVIGANIPDVSQNLRPEAPSKDRYVIVGGLLACELWCWLVHSWRARAVSRVWLRMMTPAPGVSVRLPAGLRSLAAPAAPGPLNVAVPLADGLRFLAR